MNREKEELLLAKMEMSNKILKKLEGTAEVQFSPPIDLTSTTKQYLITKITVEPGQHIIGHYNGKKLSINNCALWQMTRVLDRLCW